MEKFLKFVYFLFSFLFCGYCTIVWVLVVIYDPPLRYPIVGFLAIFFFGGMTLLFFSLLKDVFKKTDNPEETPKEKENNTPKEDEPKENDEIITVTEIKGVKKIIKNGKVIYCEQLKADELKVFEQLNEKNPTVTSGIKTYSKE